MKAETNVPYDGILTDIRHIVSGLKDKPGALLPVLHAIQKKYRYIPPAAVPVIAKVLNLSEADVHGTISFYHDFRQEPPGANVVQICRAESCQSMGARQLERYAFDVLDVDYRGTTKDRQFSLEPVYCLGNCANSPSVRINDTLHGDMTEERFEALLASIKAERIEVKVI
ncbi:formate dehydrogenase subunit gamma [Veronia nyctiphanis]|uniref:NADH-quinone oxidoreductase subunit E n=1 Tax=Veronia nyctiphanis TaxID=1278244 RepID=A0A4Q0YNP2_9GAMM|nr:formate dehydrogenase subunit gamma [Veronia nyctiphanis]RXJ72093.1 formate dehydrogenase subunit gamma [Veronia nyctiphanis]